MSDWIPFDIQIEIIKKVSNVKSLIRFRSVSKPLKSFIDSSKFIKSYRARQSQPHSCTFVHLSYKVVDDVVDEAKYICFDDNTETCKADVVSPQIKQCNITNIVGACHGLLCFYGLHKGYQKYMVVIWNPSIRKSFGIVTPYFDPYFGFGVCPVTYDPTVVELIRTYAGMFWQVEVFTLSTGVWNVIPIDNSPRASIEFQESTNVVIDRFIYWGAFEWIDRFTRIHLLVSFDMITKEFRVVDLPKSLTNELYGHFPVSVCKLRESLVVYGCIMVEEALCCGVWVMEHDLSFTKLFTIGAHVDKIFGFGNSGEPIFEAHKDNGESTTFDVYDPCSQQIKKLRIVEGKGSFFTGSYKESLLLLDHSDIQIYADDYAIIWE